jgi:hypothetical protein
MRFVGKNHHAQNLVVEYLPFHGGDLATPLFESEDH